MRQGIYAITAPSGNCYIGSAVDVRRRWYQHKHELRRGRHHSASLQAACDKYGFAALRFEFLCCVLRATDLMDVEQGFIDTLDPQYNMARTTWCPMHDARVLAATTASIRVSARHRAARIENQRAAAKAVSKPVVRLTDGVTFQSGYAAARAHGERSADNISTAIRKGWRFAGHYWKFAPAGTHG